MESCRLLFACGDLSILTLLTLFYALLYRKKNLEVVWRLLATSHRRRNKGSPAPMAQKLWAARPKGRPRFWPLLPDSWLPLFWDRFTDYLTKSEHLISCISIIYIRKGRYNKRIKWKSKLKSLDVTRLRGKAGAVLLSWYDITSTWYMGTMKNASLRCRKAFCSGSRGSRTPDPLLVRQML